MSTKVNRYKRKWVQSQ